MLLHEFACTLPGRPGTHFVPMKEKKAGAWEDQRSVKMYTSGICCVAAPNFANLWHLTLHISLAQSPDFLKYYSLDGSPSNILAFAFFLHT
jgi:hypothetical protein